jgi:predicted flap endonuclease-1-like 5' DNA nuclease
MPPVEATPEDAGDPVEDIARTEVSPELDKMPPEDAAPEDIAAEVAETDDDEPDDLMRVEGIGPVYRDILMAQGINTFEKLAALSYDQIVEAVRAGGGRRHASMETWQEQAALAAEGRWEDLDALQEKLSGGRRDG